jgi:hypothetical protein
MFALCGTPQQQTQDKSSLIAHMHFSQNQIKVSG